MSLLDRDKNSNAYQSFWTETDSSLLDFQSPEPFLQDKFLLKTSDSFQEYEICLTPNFLFYKIDENQARSVKIKWAVVESFYEEDSGICLYGFRLLKNEGKEDFYTTSEALLEKWLEKLARLSLLTGFEQDFLVVKTIDSGKFGEVYLCKQLESPINFAVKCIKKHFLQTPEQRKHIRSEIKALRSINHPLCIRLFRVYEEPEALFLVTDYHPHGTLLTRLQRFQKFQEPEVALIAHQLITALIYLNSRSVIHRDLKLDNILMMSPCLNTDIKIIDFGLACSSKIQILKCGSPGFMAPEMLRDEEYDKKADIFSIGVICYTLITGKMPFAGKNIKDLLEKNKKCHIKFDKKDWKNCSPVGINFIQGLLNKDKMSRPTAELALTHTWLSRFVRKFDSEGFTQTSPIVYIGIN